MVQCHYNRVYPVFLSLQYEILFCIQSTTDPSLKVVEDLRQQYPHIDVTVLTGG